MLPKNAAVFERYDQAKSFELFYSINFYDSWNNGQQGQRHFDVEMDVLKTQKCKQHWKQNQQKAIDGF